MNLNESEFENELRNLRPAAPSDDLARRIAGELPRQPLSVATRSATAAILRRPDDRESFFVRCLRSLGWACGGAFAAIATLAVIQAPAKRIEPPRAELPSTLADTFQPVESITELVANADEGPLLEVNHEPVRQVRSRFIERHAWVNPATGTRMVFEVPREEVRFMPVAMQ